MVAVFRICAIVSLIFVGVIACNNPPSSQSALQTDLGNRGNSEVRNRFVDYRAKDQHCSNSGTGKRVLISGFGLFSGADFNISGLIVEALADSQLWPEETNLTTVTENIELGEDRQLRNRSRLEADSKGARTWQRTITINDKTVTLCLVHLEVLWDLAGAIAIYEASLFQPDMIVMMGRGGFESIIETGALNEALTMSGFDGDGVPHSVNTPVGTGRRTPLILPQDHPGIGSQIAMTWDAAALKEAAEPWLEHLPFVSMRVAPGPRSSNNYICNNISFIVLNALRGNPVKLAGSTLIFDPTVTDFQATDNQVIVPVSSALTDNQVTAGFLHLPYNADDSKATVVGWARVVAAMITAN
mgnify:FL=1